MATLKELLNETTTNQTKKALQNYLIKNYNKIDEMQADDLELILNNDYKITNELHNTIKNYAMKKAAKNTLDKLLLVKLTKKIIDNILTLKYFQNCYNYNKSNVNTATRFFTAYNINNLILQDLAI